MWSFVVLAVLLSACTGTVYFEENFPSEDSLKDWVQSTHRNEEERGSCAVTKSKHWDDGALGLKTTQDARFYAVSKKIKTPFTNKDKTLVVQYAVKYEESVTCGGAYIKLLPSDIEQSKFHGETPYLLMFGPDICGYSKKMVHAIFNYNKQNHLIKKDVHCKDDLISHLYTFILRPNNTYVILIDNDQVEEGSLEDDWDMLPPKQIDDPAAVKPSDWVDDEEIDDPEDKKPEDWDQPKTIADENAKKPEDWDDEMDGEWERPQIDNPDYKGDWKPKRIPNPLFKGQWSAPKIDNPDYKPDDQLYVLKDIGAVGFELWQVTSGSMFHNILITDDPDYARSEGEKKWRPLFELETKKKKEEDEKVEAEAKKEAEKAKESSEKKADDKDEDESEAPDAEDKEPVSEKPDAHEEL